MTELMKPTLSPSNVQSEAKSGNEQIYSDLIRQRKQARLMALQAMYEIDSVNHAPGGVVDERLAYESPGEQGTQFFRWLVAGVVKNRAQIDALISKHAPEFPIDQLAIIDRNLLRLGLFELGSKEADTPPKVVINEAVELAKAFGSDSTPRFVNGVLGAALHEVVRKVF